MVLSTGKRADPARQQLAAFGIDINSPVNGVFLPRFKTSPNPSGAAVHASTHSHKYIDAVNEMMSWARNADEATDVLNYIRRQLQAGAWPM
jgi:hypothetical protein